MKIQINDRQFISNSEVRWYMSSQVVWIGKEKNYYEIEELIGKCYGSYKWLWSDEDTILFDQEHLNFIGAVIKLNEPIIVKRDKININSIEEKYGSIEISEKRNFDCKLSDFTEYYLEDDILLTHSNKWDVNNFSIEIKITSDFSVIVQNNEMMGIMIYKASTHLLPEGIYQIGENENIDSDLCLKIASYFKLLEKIDDDLTQHEELELKKSFMEIYDQVLPYDKLGYIALRDTILNVVDYM
ncbi:hypothetical protein [Brevibacillus sp. IT-7CA2]|uniref:hypothetical protein n=1 Tax=Brevibacillus sp. IT-7CA2 TaxID=3026436 RepID=UPI0039E0291B